MKCPYCGETMHCFREVKQAMANEGFNKAYLQEEIRKAIDSAIRSCFSENLEKYTERAIEMRCRDWTNDRVIKDAIQAAAAQALLDSIHIQLRGRATKTKEDK